MSDKQKAPKAPPQSDLPTSELIWEGTFRHLGDGIRERRPCRVVLTYGWTLHAGSKEWEAVPKYEFERATTRDLLGVPRFETTPLTELPAEFFVDVIAAFHAQNRQMGVESAG